MTFSLDEFLEAEIVASDVGYREEDTPKDESEFLVRPPPLIGAPSLLTLAACKTAPPLLIALEWTLLLSAAALL